MHSTLFIHRNFNLPKGTPNRMPSKINEFLVIRPTRLEPVRWHHHDWFILKKLRHHLTHELNSFNLTDSTQILDFGCADSPYRSLFPPLCDYTTADLPGNPLANIEIHENGTLPIRSAQFDVVLSTQVLEHVDEPSIYLRECFRVLKPGGKLLLSTHGIWPYHADPVDYWRWTSTGLKLQIERAGLEVIKLTSVGGMMAIGVQLFQSDTAWRMPLLVRQVYCFFMQRLVALFDKPYSDAGREKNAMVYILTARRPAE